MSRKIGVKIDMLRAGNGFHHIEEEQGPTNPIDMKAEHSKEKQQALANTQLVDTHFLDER